MDVPCLRSVQGSVRKRIGDMPDRDEVNKEFSILRSAVENTNEAFVTIDEDHKVYLFNKAAEKIFGYGREEVVGRDLDVIMAHECSRDHREAVSRYAKTRVPRRIGHMTQLQARRKNGETFPADISFSVSQLDGRLFFTAVIRDLTETKALEEQVIRSERLAALGKLVAEITHEIRNPLMMIGGFANQLLNEAPDEKSRKKLTIIAEEASRLDALLNDLRDFYIRRPGPGERIDLNEVLAEVLSLVDDACVSRKISVDFRRSDRPVPITGDRGRLKQVFLNLIKNSLEAMGDGGHLSIRVGSDGDHGGAVIADDGHGIPEAHLEKVFSPFFTTKRKGTGLGLSVSKSIVEDNRGTLNLTTKVGEGTTIEVRFPLAGG